MATAELSLLENYYNLKSIYEKDIKVKLLAYSHVKNIAAVVFEDINIVHVTINNRRTFRLNHLLSSLSILSSKHMDDEFIVSAITDMAISDNGEILVIGYISENINTKKRNCNVSIFKINSNAEDEPTIVKNMTYSYVVLHDGKFSPSVKVSIDNEGNNIIASVLSKNTEAICDIYHYFKNSEGEFVNEEEINITDIYSKYIKIGNRVQISGDGNNLLIAGIELDPKGEIRKYIVLYFKYKLMTKSYRLNHLWCLNQTIEFCSENEQERVIKNIDISINYDGTVIAISDDFHTSKTAIIPGFISVPEQGIVHVYYLDDTSGLCNKLDVINPPGYNPYSYFGRQCLLNKTGDKLITSAYRKNNTSNNNGTFYIVDLTDLSIAEYTCPVEKHDTFFGKNFTSDSDFNKILITGNLSSIYALSKKI